MIFNGAALLCLVGIVACAVWAFWPEVRALLGRITTDLFQDIPETHPAARGALDDLEAEGLIAWSVARGGGTEETTDFTLRHHPPARQAG